MIIPILMSLVRREVAQLVLAELRKLNHPLTVNLLRTPNPKH